MNLNSLAELNPAINYNKPQPLNLKQYDYDEYDNSMGFIKAQEKLSSVGKGESYYCGGNVGIASRHLNMEQDPLAALYFSEENMNRIQKLTRREIYRRTNGKFKILKDSDELDLLQIMDVVFDEHAKHLPDQLVRQVKRLNLITVDTIVPNAITVIDQTSKYLKQLDEPIKPMPRPLNVNNAGRKTLPSFTSVMGF